MLGTFWEWVPFPEYFAILIPFVELVCYIGLYLYLLNADPTNLMIFRNVNLVIIQFYIL